MTEPGPAACPLEPELVLDALNLLARLFWGPDQALCRDLWDPGPDLLRRLAPGLDQGGRRAAEDLAARLGEYTGPGELWQDLEPAYVALFISARGGIAAPLYHSAYGEPGLLMGPPAREMARRLARAGLEPAGRPGEPPDHLSLELEYLAWLREEGRGGDAAGFARDFVAPWLGELARRLARARPRGVFALAARVAASLVAGLGRSA